MKNYNQLIKKAKIYFDQNQFDSAKECINDILTKFELKPTQIANFYLLLGEINVKLNEFKEANDYYFKYLNSKNNNPEIFNQIANNYLKLREYKKSEEFYLKAISLDKNYETAIINLAVLFENLGKKKEALNFYKKALNLNPKNLGIFYNMYKLEKDILNSKTITLIKNYIKINDKYFDIAAGYYLLSENDCNNGDIKNELLHLEKANHFSFLSNEKINKQALNYWLNIIPKKYSNFSFSKNCEVKKNFHPIFIIGLPRSGSTLMENIISSGKDKIISYGETNLVNWSLLNTNRINLFKQEEKISLNNDIIQNKLLKFYSNQVNRDKKNKIYFLDKSLENFYYIDLILKIFPKAKFIHTYRNLYDNVFAIYKEFLSKISWSHSIENITLYINNYLETLEYFKKKFPEKILSVSLEELTFYPEDISKKVYQFCEIKWDESCLNFSEQKNLFSSTASNQQIRSGIQKYNDKKYKNYYNLLEIYKNKYSWL